MNCARPHRGLIYGARFAAAHESAVGPSRRFPATQQFGRFRSEADIQQAALIARGTHRDELAEAIIANVVADDLYAAVIDR
jgi:hypothetical protein